MKPTLFLLILCSGAFLHGPDCWGQAMDESVSYRLTLKKFGDTASLDVRNDGEHKNVHLARSADYSGQLWKFKQERKGMYRITNAWLGEEKALAVVNDGKKTSVHLADRKNTLGQLWTISPAADGFIQITSVWVGRKKSLEVAAGGSDELRLAVTRKGANQLWLVTPLPPMNEAAEAETEPGQPVAPGDSLYTLSDEEARLYQLVMAYRREHGLPSIPRSPALTFVAKTHVRDLADHAPDTDPCNAHSWSDKGNWTPCCYTEESPGDCMWSKPKELTTYKGAGFEVSYGGSHPDLKGNKAGATDALESWKTSESHNAVLLNQDIWSEMTWRAIGIGIYKGFAVIWFGEEEDGGSRE